MKFLVIVQDLRVSGTSEGIVSRSFLSKLRKVYPKAIIDVLYLKSHQSNDCLKLLPVNTIETHVLNIKIPFYRKWFNKFYWRVFHVSLNERYINSIYASHISNVDYQKYNHIFIRSSGLNYETILASKNLPILKRSIINFHDPYPLFWNSGGETNLSNLELFRLKNMMEVVSKAKKCITPSSLLSQDMQFLYGSRAQFYTLPHQFDKEVFDLSDYNNVKNKTKKVTVTYHGAVQFGRNVEILLDAYQELINDNYLYKENTEFVLRLKGQLKVLNPLKIKYSKNDNINILTTLNFSNSCYEQSNEADINIILENGNIYSNILVGKAPFLASLKKPILSISPKRSELRNILAENRFIANGNDKKEIKLKLENLIIDRMNFNEAVQPFGTYFDITNFKEMLNVILFK